MYLVAVLIETPGWQASAEEVKDTLHRCSTSADGVQHAYVATTLSRLLLSLYLQASAGPAALIAADRLARRTMRALPAPGRWMVSSVELGP